MQHLSLNLVAVAVAGCVTGIIVARIVQGLVDFAATKGPLRDQDVPRVCAQCEGRFTGEAMRYCISGRRDCRHAIWAEPEVRALGKDWHLHGDA